VPSTLPPIRPAVSFQPAAPVPTNPTAAPGLLTFEPQRTELRWSGGHWQVYAGAVLLKDFGTHQSEAREALNLIRALRLTQYGTVGTPQPILEYWLSNGQAPFALGGGLRLLPIDQASLRVEQVQGLWVVRDASRALFNFGVQEAQANQAVAVLKHYGFTHVGYVGQPTPLMMYFLGDGGQRPAAGNVPPAAVAGPGSGAAGAPLGAGQSPEMQRHLLTASVRQLAPPQTDAQDFLRFDPRHVEVKADQGQWQLVYGEHVLASLPNQFLARQALEVLQYYRFTEECVIGSPPAFTYFLVHGQAPRGLKFGVHSMMVRPDAVSVRQMGTQWVLCDGDEPVVSFGSNRENANTLAQVIQRYRFDHVCRVGPPGPQSMTFLAKVR
jgi:hypothetical protein